MSDFDLDIDWLHRDILNEETSPRSGNTVRWCVEVMGMIGLGLTPIYIEVPTRRLSEYYMRNVLLPLLVSQDYVIERIRMSESFWCDGCQVRFVIPGNPRDYIGSGFPRYIVRSDYWRD